MIVGVDENEEGVSTVSLLLIQRLKRGGTSDGE